MLEYQTAGCGTAQLADFRIGKTFRREPGEMFRESGDRRPVPSLAEVGRHQDMRDSDGANLPGEFAMGERVSRVTSTGSETVLNHRTGFDSRTLIIDRHRGDQGGGMGDHHAPNPDVGSGTEKTKRFRR